MDTEGLVFAITWIIGAACGIVAGILISLYFNRLSGSSLKQEAIDLGYAEYCQTTGDWQWKEDYDKLKEELQELKERTGDE